MDREKIIVLGADTARVDEIARSLEAAGFEPRPVHDAHAALRSVWEEHPPLVVIDLFAPGIDGAFVSKSLKSEPGSPKILAIAEEPRLLELKRTLRREHRPDEAIGPDKGGASIVDRAASMLHLRNGNEISGSSSIDRSFAGLLTTVWRQSSTGILDVEAEGVRTTLFFLNGEPIFAEHGTLRDSLGRMLVRTGLITEHQLARAIEKMNDRRAGSEQMRLGESLIALGMLSPRQVHDAIKEQVREKFLACFHWKSLRHRFDERRDFLHDVGIFKCAVLPLLFEGIRRAYDPQRLHAILGPRLDRYPRLRDDLTSVTHRFGLGTAEQQFLRMITGNRSIASLQEASNLDRLLAGQVLAALIISDQIELWADPSTSDLNPREGSQDLPRAISSLPPADEGESILHEYLRLKGKSDADVLCVSPNATRDEILAAFARGEERFGPSATRNLPAHVARKASEIYALMRSSSDRMLEALESRKRRTAGHR